MVAMEKVRDLDALQYMWYVKYDEEKSGPPAPVWELDMGVVVETTIHGGQYYTTTTFYSQSNPNEWIRTGQTVDLTEAR